MRLTIIPSDGTVYKDGVSYSNLIWEGTPLDIHALQWQDVAGWLEFNNEKPNEDIAILPDWADNALAAWTIANTPTPPAPTPEEIQTKNLAKAKNLLLNSDYTQLADVNLTNKSDWATYRNLVREIANNPPTTPSVFPLEPPLIWNN